LLAGCPSEQKADLEEDALERFVAAGGAFEVADLARLLEHGRKAGGGGELVGGGEALDASCLGDELGREGGPHPRQAADEGRVRVLVERGRRDGSRPA
jgi:hypothetical protein